MQDLVDEKRSLETLKEERWVVLRLSAIFQRIQRNVVPPFLPADLKNGRLALLTRAGQEQNRKELTDFSDVFINGPGERYGGSD